MHPISSRKNRGVLGEKIACQYLENKDFKILEKNYRKPWGEIDIIAEKAGILHFVEVKAVSREPGFDISREMDYRPEELVTKSKLRKVARTATLYMEAHRDDREYQIDVIGVVLLEETRTARCRFFEQVIEEL